MRRSTATALAWLAATLALQAQDPFAVETALQRGTVDVLSVTFRIPADHYLYEHMMRVEALRPEGVTLKPTAPPCR